MKTITNNRTDRYNYHGELYRNRASPVKYKNLFKTTYAAGVSSIIVAGNTIDIFMAVGRGQIDAGKGSEKDISIYA